MIQLRVAPPFLKGGWGDLMFNYNLFVLQYKIVLFLYFTLINLEASQEAHL